MARQVRPAASPYAHRAKPFRWEGESFESLTAFCTRFGLCYSTVKERLRAGITGKDLVKRRLRQFKGTRGLRPAPYRKGESNVNRRGFISLLVGVAGAPLVPWRKLIEPVISLPPQRAPLVLEPRKGRVISVLNPSSSPAFVKFGDCQLVVPAGGHIVFERQDGLVLIPNTVVYREEFPLFITEYA